MKEYIINFSESIIPWLLSTGIRIVIIAVAAYLLNKILIKIIKRAIIVSIKKYNNDVETEGKKREETLIRIFSGITRGTIIIIALLIILTELGIKIAPILAGAGIVGVAVGFGAQYLIKDLISGLFIIIENQYRVGDVVNFDGIGGLVEDITLRMTTLRDLDGTVHHIPHGNIKSVSNLSKEYARINLNIGISYSSNLEHVIMVVNKTGNELAEDPAWKDAIIKAPQFLRIDDFADSAIIIKILGETKPIQQWEVTGELRKRIKIAFDTEGIEIPFPQTVIHHAKD
ncbi:MAG: mechanosensitive ion channel family protein [Bacteroidales bacterium]